MASSWTGGGLGQLGQVTLFSDSMRVSPWIASQSAECVRTAVHLVLKLGQLSRSLWAPAPTWEWALALPGHPSPTPSTMAPCSQCKFYERQKMYINKRFISCTEQGLLPSVLSAPAPR